MAIIQTVFGLTASYVGASQGVYVDLPSALSWDGQQNENIGGVQAVFGSSFNDVIWSTAGNIVLDGGPAGADDIHGAAGNTLSYFTSNSGVYVDLTAGVTWDGQNHDVISNFSSVIGSNFNDTVFGTSGADVINGGLGADTLYGFDGIDTVSYTGSPTGVIIDLNSGVTWDGANNDQISSFENATGGDYDDTFYGVAGVSNHFDGGLGSDTMYFPTIGSNKFTNGVVVDLHDSDNESSTYPLGNTYDQDQDTFTGIENAFGGDGDDHFISGPESNTFNGKGNTSPTYVNLYGHRGGDTVDYNYSEGPVIVDLSVNASWDGHVNDHLFDIENVVGSQFNDTFYSSTAPNYLDGGQGSDTYIFTPGFNSDTIANLQDGTDHIRLLQFESISYQSLLITPDIAGGSDVRIAGDSYSSDSIHVLGMNPGDLTADWFLFN